MTKASTQKSTQQTKFRTHYNHQEHKEKGGGVSITEQCDTAILSVLRNKFLKNGGYAINKKMTDEEMLATEDKTRRPDYDMIDAKNEVAAIAERKREAAEARKRAAAAQKAQAAQNAAPIAAVDGAQATK